MIKQVPVKELKVGMYISDLNRDWIPHNNAKQHGKLKTDVAIDQIKRLGVEQVYIDTDKGVDAVDGIPIDIVDAQNQKELDKVGQDSPNYKHKNTVEQEREKADKLHNQARKHVEQMLTDVKMGKAIDVDNFDSLSEGMLDSINRNHNALACLGRIREKDSYLMEHSINLGVLMSIYGKYKKFDRGVLHKVMVGALLHDIGKILVPDDVLHKPAKLSDGEFQVMKGHVNRGTAILKTTPGISELTILVQSQHHEKLDGSGYPLGLKGDEISQYGKMAAITDVYDAITADRCYHKGLQPSNAMKKLLEWSGTHLDKELVVDFIKCMGIYPVGSLVQLDSGRLGVVIEANEHDQLKPKLKVIYSTTNNIQIEPQVLDLAKPLNQDHILKAVNPEVYKLNVNSFI